MLDCFIQDIRALLEKVPASIWEDRSVCGLLYDFSPWHSVSSVSVQIRSDDLLSPADWRFFECSCSDGEFVREAIDSYEAAPDQRMTYHGLLIKAAEALLQTEFQSYGQPQTTDDFFLYKPFQLRVEDPDETFCFNYCEYVLAKKLEDRLS